MNKSADSIVADRTGDTASQKALDEGSLMAGVIAYGEATQESWYAPGAWAYVGYLEHVRAELEGQPALVYAVEQAIGMRALLLYLEAPALVEALLPVMIRVAAEIIAGERRVVVEGRALDEASQELFRSSVAELKDLLEAMPRSRTSEPIDWSDLQRRIQASFPGVQVSVRDVSFLDIVLDGRELVVKYLPEQRYRITPLGERNELLSADDILVATSEELWSQLERLLSSASDVELPTARVISPPTPKKS